MRINIITVLTSVFLFLFSFFYMQRLEEKENFDSGITVSNSVGAVSIKYPKELWWRGLSTGDFIPLSSVVRTSSESFVKINFFNGDELLIGGMSLIKILLKENNEVDINVYTGKLYLVSKGNGKINSANRKINLNKADASKLELDLVHQTKDFVELDGPQINIIEAQENDQNIDEKIVEIENKLKESVVEKKNENEILPVAQEALPEMEPIQLPKVIELKVDDE